MTTIYDFLKRIELRQGRVVEINKYEKAAFKPKFVKQASLK